MHRPEPSKKKNTHIYVKGPICKCGNNKYKLIKSTNKLECSRCKITSIVEVNKK